MNTSIAIHNIKRAALLHFIFPLVPIGICVFFLIKVPYIQIFSPITIDINNDISLTNQLTLVTNGDNEYVDVVFPKLQYTGYDLKTGDEKLGSYYYYISKGECIFVLLDSDNLDKSTSALYDRTVRVKKCQINDMVNNMIVSFSQDIKWTSEGIHEVMPNYYLNEHEYFLLWHIISFAVLCIVIIMSSYISLLNLFTLIWPRFFHKGLIVYRLSIGITYEDMVKSFDDINNELSNKLIDNIGSAYITDNFLLDTNKHTTMILRNDSIIWIYSHQRLLKFLWWNIKLYSSMTFVTSNGCQYTLHWKLADDARDIYSYYEENYPDIILKYSKTNKAIAKEIISRSKDMTKALKV